MSKKKHKVFTRFDRIAAVPANIIQPKNFMSRLVRTLAISFITLVCTAATLHVFDWPMVLLALTRMHIGLFVAGGLALMTCIFTVRGMRWLAVLGLPFDRSRLWQSFCANGAASGLAALTPFQLGEVIKVRLIPDHHGSAWRMGVSALLVERLLDLAGVAGVGLCGVALHLKLGWIAPIALLLPIWCGQLFYLLRPLTRHLPKRLKPYLQLPHSRRHITGASLLTTMLWLLYAALWWLTVTAMNVSVDFGQISLLLGGVMLAVVASMTPGGLGVAELGSQGILLWLGKSHADADSSAIALRLLTPLLVLAGGACMFLLWLYRRTAVLQKTVG